MKVVALFCLHKICTNNCFKRMFYWDNRGGGSPQLFHIDGKYVIVYDGVYREGDWSNYTRNIGMLISETPNGPWTRVSDMRPIISTGKDTSDFDHFLACNPSLVKHPDGRYFI